MTPAELIAAQQRGARRCMPRTRLLDYLQALIAATRSGHWFVEGLCPRAGIAVLRAARARALLGAARLRGARRRAGRPAADHRAPPGAGGRRRARPRSSRCAR